MVADVAAELTAGVYLADDDSLHVYSDKYNFYIRQDSTAAGDRDMALVFVEEDGTEWEILLNEGDNVFKFSKSIETTGDMFVGDDMNIDGDDVRCNASVTTVDWNNTIGTGILGGAADTTRIPTIAYFDCEGIAWFDSTVTFAQAIDVDSTNTDHLVVNEAGDAIVVGAWTRYLDIGAGAAVLGPTAPSWSGTAGNSAYGLAFDANAEIAGLNPEIPDDWNGTSDILLRIYWVAQSTDHPQLNETIIWKAGYRSIVFGTEDINNGTVVLVAAPTYTEDEDPGDDAETHISTITLDYDSGTQPLTSGDLLIMAFYRDVDTDTYSGDGIVLNWELEYTSIGLPNHN